MPKPILEPIKGVVMSYRRSRNIIHPKQAILHFPGYEDRARASDLLGHKVEWTSSSGRVIRGKITRVHGNNGAVVARFAKGGLPGEAFGEPIICF